MAVSRAVLAGNPIDRAARTNEVASRLMSHSQGAGQSLVEIIDVEQDVAFGRGEAPEIHQVAVAASLDLDSGVRRGAEIGRHDARRSPVEGEGRLQHAPIADGNELGNAIGICSLQEGERVGAASVRRPCPVLRAWNAITECLPGLHPLRQRHRLREFVRWRLIGKHRLGAGAVKDLQLQPLRRREPTRSCRHGAPSTGNIVRYFRVWYAVLEIRELSLVPSRRRISGGVRMPWLERRSLLKMRHARGPAQSDKRLADSAIAA